MSYMKGKIKILGGQINMKGKFRILGHVGLALFVAVALMLAAVPAAKVEATPDVSSVWVEFAETGNNTGNNAQYTIHFTTGSALSRGVDTITVLFPDGMDSTMGPITTQDDYDFELGAADASAAYYQVDPTGDPLGTGAAYVTCTQDATVAGYRVKVTTPVDIPASTAATLQILVDADILTPAVAANTYMIKLATSQDTSFVLSSAFSVDGTILDAAPLNVTSPTTYPTSLLAGDGVAYKFDFDPATEVPSDGTGTVTVQFPVGTYLPNNILVEHIIIGDNHASTGDDKTCSAVTVDPAARTVTATTRETLEVGDTDSYIYFKTGCLITNPTTIGTKQIHMWTSTDGQKKASATDLYTIVGASASKLAFASKVGAYSDDATIVNAYTGALIIESQDAHGNIKHITTTEPTVKLSVVTGSGTFHTTAHASGGDLWSASGVLMTAGTDDAYYMPTSAGTHTLKAETYGSPDLADATWTVYVAPGVVLKDASGNTIGTYAPAANSWLSTYGGAHIQAAIDAAFPGDTVELGGTADDPAIYEVDATLCLNKQITLTSATSALYTTIRPVDEPLTGFYFPEKDLAMYVFTDGSAANPIIIDGLTFDRLRSGDEFDIAIYNNGYDYVTVRNCTFNYIIPEEIEDNEWGAVVAFVIAPNQDANANTITSATISNNKFNNCCAFYLAGGDSAVINLMTKASASSMSITGATVSGNELTDCNGINISIEGYNSTNSCYVTANVTDNIITDGKLPMYINQQTDSVNVLRNTITGGYNYGIRVGSYLSANHDDLVIKNNTITGCAGAQSATASYAIWLQEDGGTTVTDINTVQFNDIYDNDAEYSIFAESTINTFAQDCQYNWYGDASGPYHATTNPNGLGEKVSSLVTYSPWLHKSKAFVVTDNANYCAQRVSLGVGWNTLSTPALLITTANTIAELMPDYVTNMEYGYQWDPAAGGWVNIGTSSLAPCSAYYIKMNVADSVVLQYAANETDTPSKLLSPGWNLIGLANLSNKRVDDAVASVLLDSAGLPGYSQVISPSMNATPWSYSAGEGDATVDMVVGEGYWIWMQNDCTLAGFTMLPLVPDLD